MFCRSRPHLHPSEFFFGGRSTKYCTYGMLEFCNNTLCVVKNWGGPGRPEISCHLHGKIYGKNEDERTSLRFSTHFFRECHVNVSLMAVFGTNHQGYPSCTPYFRAPKPPRADQMVHFFGEKIHSPTVWVAPWTFPVHDQVQVSLPALQSLVGLVRLDLAEPLHD